jgi:hypothetical protein
MMNDVENELRMNEQVAAQNSIVLPFGCTERYALALCS